MLSMSFWPAHTVSSIIALLRLCSDRLYSGRLSSAARSSRLDCHAAASTGPEKESRGLGVREELAAIAKDQLDSRDFDQAKVVLRFKLVNTDRDKLQFYHSSRTRHRTGGEALTDH